MRRPLPPTNDLTIAESYVRIDHTQISASVFMNISVNQRLTLWDQIRTHADPADTLVDIQKDIAQERTHERQLEQRRLESEHTSDNSKDTAS